MDPDIVKKDSNKLTLLSILNELTLNTDNAVEVKGTVLDGRFKVNNIEFMYKVTPLSYNPYSTNEPIYSISFNQVNDTRDNPNLPTGNLKNDYIKVLSTMYKVVIEFVNNKKPSYIGISSYDDSGYWNIYNQLTKQNKIPGYQRINSGLEFKDKNNNKGKIIILKHVK